MKKNPLKNIRELFSLRTLDQKLLELEDEASSALLIIASVAAGLGYVLFAMPLLLTLIGIIVVTTGIGSAHSLSAWLHLLLWAGISVAGMAILFAQLRVKISTPSGLGLKEDKAPRLYELLNSLGENYKLPHIHRLVVHEKFSLEFVPVPRFGLPFLHTNVLYIGLPVLQALSPAEFKGALAGLLGQYSGVQNRKTHWVYRWHQYCEQNQRAYKKHNSLISHPMSLFFRFYTPLLKYLAAGSLRQDRLESDIYMLEIMNDSDVADVILHYEVSQAFIKNKYWPKIFAMLRKNPAKPEALPHINMAKVLRNGLSENEFAQTLKQLMDQEKTWLNIKPDVHTRLQNIGQSKLNMPPPVMETAAQRYLADAYSAVIKMLDKQWLAKYAKASKTIKSTAKNDASQQDSPVTHTKQATETDRLQNISSEQNATISVTERKRFAELKQKAESANLVENEAWELAYLTEKLEGKSAAIRLYQHVLKQNPNHAKTLFAVGRILLGNNDASGVKILERAMKLDKGCIAQSCWMLAKYFKASGDDARSKEYLERAANIGVAA